MQISAQAFQVKDWFAEQPTRAIVDEIREFIRAGNAPYEWRGHTHTKPPKGPTLSTSATSTWIVTVHAPERNVHGQCGVYNRWKPGNLVAYSLYFEEKYGPGILQELRKFWIKPKKWMRAELEAIRTRCSAQDVNTR